MKGKQRQILSGVNDITNSTNNETKTNNTKFNEWIKVKQSPLHQLILEAFSDLHKKNILNITSEKPLTIPEILQTCKMSTPVGYRKINSLIKAGFVRTVDTAVQNGKKVKKYASIFEDVKIYIDKDTIRVKVKLKK